MKRITDRLLGASVFLQVFGKFLFIHKVCPSAAEARVFCWCGHFLTSELEVRIKCDKEGKKPPEAN